MEVVGPQTITLNLQKHPLADFARRISFMNAQGRAVSEGVDSFSILPLLLGHEKEYVRPEALIQHSSRGIFVVRQGDWKLILELGSGGFSKPETIKAKAGEPAGQLYNLREDIAETRNLWLQFPDKVKELYDILKKYHETRSSRN